MSEKLELLLSNAGVDFKTRNEWIKFNCPYCGDSHKHAAFTPLGACTCFKCGKLPPVKTLMLIAHVPYALAKSTLGVKAGKEAVCEPKKAIQFTWPSGTMGLHESHVQYLLKRNVKLSVAEAMGLKGTNHLSTIPHSIVIPVTKNGKRVSWTTRSMNPHSDLRYVTCPKENEVESIKDCLLGWEHTGGTVILVEGPMDMLSIGFGAVASFGKTLSTEQIKMLRTKSEIYVCLDGNEHTSMSELDMVLHPAKTYSVFLEGKDASATSEEERNQLRSLLR